MALVSPGVQVSITDESFFSSSGPGTVPLIMIATKQDKLTPDGSGIAPGTTAANADKLYLIASQRELLQTFGDPDFNEIGGTAQNGYPLNEYGLLAAYSYLGAANRAYVVRADIDLNELDPSTTEPTTAAADDTYWLDTSSVVSGLKQWNGTAWVSAPVSLIVTEDSIVNDAEPSSGYQAGDIAMNITTDGTTDDIGIYFVRRSTSNALWEDIGSSASRTTHSTDFQWGPAAAVPTVGSDGLTPLAVGDLWLNISPENSGLSVPLSYYDAGTGQWITVSLGGVAPFGFSQIAESHSTYYALSAVDSASVEAGTIVGFIDSGDSFTGGTTQSARPHNGNGMDSALGNIVLEYHTGESTVTAESSAAVGAFPIAAASTIDINGTTTGDLASANIDALVIALNSDTALTSEGIVATKNGAVGSETIVLTSSDGRDIVIASPVGEASKLNLATGTYSNFKPIATAVTDGDIASYNVSATQPVGAVADGTYWYDPTFSVDLLVNDGQGGWIEITDDVFVQSDEPATPTNGDIWVETDNVDEYPVIYRRTAGSWVLVDNTDQVTSLGIIFADARPDTEVGVTGTGINNDGGTNPNLDSDRPDPLLYPGGMLLWNTRASGRNVKVWTASAVTSGGADTATTDKYGAYPAARWVSASGNNADGSLKTGQDAQKALVTEKLAEVLVGNEELRDDTIFYNLIAAPGFPELIDEMITLNVDRKEQAFVIGDSPFNLSNSTTALQAWASNSNSAAGNGDDGLVTADTYLGVYYPSGLSTNVDGNEVVVPASHMVLRVMATNDQTAYPWYAPAGFTRGTVTNATSVGYLNSSDEFVPVSLTQGQRDVLQQNNVNPIANIPNRGLVVFGQKTRQATASALDRVNVARLVNYIRYQADQLAQPFLFEPNDSVTRNIVKDAFDSFLAELVTLRGLNDFLVVVDESNNTPARIDRNELWIDIAIQPIKSVEFIFIPIRIRNTGDDLNL